MSFTEHLTVGWNQASSFVSTHVPSFIRDRRMDSKLVIGISASIAAVITASALHRFIQIQRAQSDGTPMVSYKFPIIGSTREYRKDPRAFLEKYEAKYGPVYRAHLFGRICTVVSDQYVREVFLNNNFNFEKAFNGTFDVHLVADISDDHFSMDAGRIIVQKYLTTEMKGYTPRVVESLKLGAEEHLGSLDEPKTLPHLYPLVQHAVATASASIFVGEKLAKDKDLIETFKNLTLDVGKEIYTTHPILEAFSWMSRLRMWVIGKNSFTVQKHKRVIEKAVGPEIAYRLEQMRKYPDTWERPNDMLQNIVENYLPPPPGYTATQYVTDWLVGLIFASVHTTSENGTVVLYRVMQHPEVIPEILEEVNQVMAGKDRVMDGEDIKSMAKLDSLCRETMRLKNIYLSLPHRNVGKEPITLSNGSVVKPGHDVIINYWNNHSHNRMTGSLDNSFKPFRFVDQDKQASKVGNDFLPFGLGKHACPGRWFALQEIKTLIAQLLQDYHFEAVDEPYFPTGEGNVIPFGQVKVSKKL